MIRIEACRGNLIRNELQNVNQDIKAMTVQFTSVGFLWIKREGNAVVDYVVKLAASNRLAPN